MTPRRLGVLVLLGWLLFVAGSLLLARSDVRAGMKAVDDVRAHGRPSDLAEGRLLPDLERARARFSRASDRLGNPLLAPARALPFAGRQLVSVSSLAAAAAQVVDVGVDGLADANQALDAAPGAPVGERIRAVRRLGELAGSADDRLGGTRLGPRVGLLPALARARNDFAADLAEVRTGLRRAAIGAPALADLLEGPRRYLVFAANNAEMRAGSGMLLSVGELVTGPDGLKLGVMRSVTDIPVPAGAVTLDGDLADRWGWLGPNQEWRNLMTSPRFDVAAPLAARMWEAAGNQPVDGVLALDPVTLRGLLTATGSVTVDDRTIGPDDVVEELLHGQYLRFPGVEEFAERREGLGRVAGAVFEALDAGRWSAAHLVDGLADAAGGRHLLLWSARAEDQAGWQALGVDGSLQPDSTMVSVLNRGGNKLDRFLEVSADLSFRADGPDTEVIVRLDLRNTVPEGEPQYVAGPERNSGVGEGVYLGILALTLPGSASDARFDDVSELVVAGRDGPTRVVGFQLQLERGESRTVVARFRVSGRTGALRVEPSARVPAVRWSSGPSRWEDFSTRVVRWDTLIRNNA